MGREAGNEVGEDVGTHAGRVERWRVCYEQEEADVAEFVASLKYKQHLIKNMLCSISF